MALVSPFYTTTNENISMPTCSKSDWTYENIVWETCQVFFYLLTIATQSVHYEHNNVTSQLINTFTNMAFAFIRARKVKSC